MALNTAVAASTRRAYGLRMASSNMPTAGFGTPDHKLRDQVAGAGPLTDGIMRAVGAYGISSQSVVREIIAAIAELESRDG